MLMPKVVPFLLFFAGIYHASLAVKPLINSQFCVVIPCFKLTLIHSRTTNKKLCLKHNLQSAITATNNGSVCDLKNRWKTGITGITCNMSGFPHSYKNQIP